MQVSVVDDEHARAWPPRVVTGLVVAVVGGMVIGRLADAAGEGDGIAGGLAALVWCAEVRRAAKLAAAAVAVVLGLAMGISRVCLGYHWGTDVLAGWIVALAWLCLLATAVHFVRYGQSRRL